MYHCVWSSATITLYVTKRLANGNLLFPRNYFPNNGHRNFSRKVGTLAVQQSGAAASSKKLGKDILLPILNNGFVPTYGII